ncbi:UDP-glucosyltransferase 2-like [Melitaea cinxia]|uniref:UDP-glucosyltransferase 2-like n=1 Tax=Melitaea cinxia TaxID=113334 RepID=UPI001E272E48|nr:UDP-glucosyltransferase 2-like [Melitaea cinxia]
MYHRILVLFLSFLFVTTEAAKILGVFPMPSLSHQIVFRRITQELAKRGHEVTVITTDPAFPEGNGPTNLKEIDIHDVSYALFQETFQTKYKAGAMKHQTFAEMREGLRIFSSLFHIQVQTPQVQELITNKNNTFDLILIEAVTRPDYLNQFDVHEMLKQDFGSDVPALEELYNNVHLLFLNIHPIWADNQPVPPGVIFTGGIHQLPEKELPKDLKTYLDSSKRGVIYVSFGTNILARMFEPETVKIIVNVLSKLPYDVLWKWDQDELPGNLDNIKISKWLPQSDLLRHPKMKLFVTQAGLQSTDEAITAGVPLVAIPMLADQWYNAQKYVKHGIGMKLDIDFLTEDKLKHAIETVISDESYRRNIIKLRDIMRDQPETPLERAIWWLEYAIRHGGAKQLRAPTANISTAEYFELELVLIVLSIAVAAFMLFICFLCRLGKEAAKILGVFPIPSISHQVVFRKITQELVKKGHEVTVITPDPAFPEGNGPANLKEIDVHDVSYAFWQSIFQSKYKAGIHNTPSFSELREGTKLFSYLLHIQIETPMVRELITNKNNKFDLILVEAVMRPALVFSHIFKAPVILMSSFGAIFNNHDIMGSLTHPILYPSTLQFKIYNLTFWEKIEALRLHYTYEYASYLNEFDEHQILQQDFGSDVPAIKELYNNVHMLFLNIHPVWADNQPVPPGVVFMGGIHQLPQKELPKDLKTYLDSSKRGVIYVSFGTNVLAGMISPDKVQVMVNVLSKLPYDVLWKWDQDELPGKSDNIRTSKWLPQSDLLKHPKIKLFVTQAGLQSTDEAITAGVPLVAIPMLGDQWYNAEKYLKHGIGMKLAIDSLTEEQLKYAIETVITDESYRRQVTKLRDIMLDQPETPLERAMWWLEYAIRHGGAKQLRAPTANISMAEYLELELVLIVLLTAVTALILLILIFVYER